MAILPILHYPDARLKTVAKPVTRVDAGIRALVTDMAETMYAAPGIGLAATQVDVHQQVVVIDLSETHDQLLILINPRILARDGLSVQEEGCLSVPGIYEKVERAATVRAEYLDLEGKAQSLEAEGLLAVCIQHEIDHLQGKVFVERLSRLKQMRIRDKIAKKANDKDQA
ncbi:MAG: peptide deformylase [Zoogloeaceae bacterium]|jgi:peptide deformylase|nr:peptide deformylase [Zoogloeaceae bacterium]